MNLNKIFKILFPLIIGVQIISCGLLSDTLDVKVDSGPFKNFDPIQNIQLTEASEFIVIIPDIQFYTVYKENHYLLDKLISRIIEIHDAGFKIKAVLQVGDITDRNTKDEWESVKTVFSKLDNKIDYILCTGNHDYGDNGTCNNRNTLFNDYFQYNENKSFITGYQQNNYENSWFQFSIQGQPFQLFSLEFGPRDEVVTWADSMANLNKEKYGILLTHAYLATDNKRFDYANLKLNQTLSPYAWTLNNPEFEVGKVNDGQQLWSKFLVNNNFQFVFCGHLKSATNYLISINQSEQEVLQMVFAEHNMPQAIEGWVQILEFYADKKTVGVKTYSTLLNTWKTDSVHQYDFTYNLIE